MAAVMTSSLANAETISLACKLEGNFFKPQGFLVDVEKSSVIRLEQLGSPSISARLAYARFDNAIIDGSKINFGNTTISRQANRIEVAYPDRKFVGSCEKAQIPMLSVMTVPDSGQLGLDCPAVNGDTGKLGSTITSTINSVSIDIDTQKRTAFMSLDQNERRANLADAPGDMKDSVVILLIGGPVRMAVNLLTGAAMFVKPGTLFQVGSDAFLCTQRPFRPH